MTPLRMLERFAPSDAALRRAGFVSRVALVCGFLAVAHGSSVGAQTLRGILVDEHTGEPVALGQVKLVSSARDSLDGTLTTEEGFFFLSAPAAGEYSIVAEAFGYWSAIIGPVQLERGQDRIVEARVSARPVEVEGVTVETESEYEPRVHHLVSNGFYDRLGRGKGEFITPGEIARSTSEYVQGLFYEREFTRVFQTRTATGRTARELNRGEGARSEGRATTFGPWGDRVLIPTPIGYCEPVVYLDGIKMLGEFEGLADLVTMAEVEAIEIYKVPFDVELELFDLARIDCGALVIWTKGREPAA